jgi:TolA-binding protein
MRRVANALLASIFIPGLACLPWATASADTPQEQLAAASTYFDRQKYSEAAAILQTFLQEHPTHPRVAAAAVTLGRCRLELKQYEPAIPAFQQALTSKDPDILTQAELGLGQAAINAHKYAVAVSPLQAATKANLKPDQAAVVWYWLGLADFQLKRYAQSEEAYRRVASDFGRSDFAPSAAYGAGLAALKQGKTDVAREELNAYLDRYPQDGNRPYAALQLARMDEDAGHYSEARSTLEEILNAVPASAKTSALRADAEDELIRALLQLKDYSAAVPHLEAALSRLPATDPQHYRAELSLGHCRYHQQQYQEAIVAYRAALGSTEPSVASQAQYWVANALLGAGKPLEAAKQFEEFAARFPHDKLAAHSELRAADALLAAKQSSRAAGAYQQVAERFPGTPDAAEARKGLGSAMDAISDPAQLAVAVKEVTGQERARATIRLARIYLTGKRYADATDLLSAYLQHGTGVSRADEASYLLGVGYDLQQKPAQALPPLVDATHLNPTASWATDAHLRLARLYLHAKQGAQAEKAANAVLDQQPDAEQTRQARLLQVQALIAQQKWEPALQACQALMEGNPSSETLAGAIYTQGWINVQRGKPAEALPFWQRLAEEYPKDPDTAEALLNLGHAYLKAQQNEEARKSFATLLADFPKSRFRAEAHYNLGIALFNLNQYDDAAAQYDTVAEDASADALKPDALYWAGVSYNKSGKKQTAMLRLSRLVKDYPQNSHVSNAKVYLAALKAGG